MRLSDLLHRPVVDADGRPVGRVHDVLVRRGAPLLSGHVGPLKVEGLLIGASLGTRLGFERGGVTGPWPLSAISRRLTRRSRFAPWPTVVDWNGDEVRLSVRAGELDHLPDIGGEQ